MRGPVTSFRAAYGANPLHLLALLGCFALTGYVAVLLAEVPTLPRMLLWFCGSIVAHDLLLFPLYALADRSLRGASRLRRRRPRVPAVNHVRLPVLGSGLLLLLFLPGIVQQGAGTYLAATGQTQEPFLERWLLISGSFFLISALCYAMRAGFSRQEDHHE